MHCSKTLVTVRKTDALSARKKYPVENVQGTSYRPMHSIERSAANTGRGQSMR